ncbi:MAG: hypothetical protein HY709_05585 [Candidatus Latescibacteria bacterium]|nr:hypothetical protein [Candidatus Latescibacterota bacterium]
MTAKRFSSIWFTTLVVGSFFLWGCSDAPQPTASDGGDIQEKLTVSGGNGIRSTSGDTLHPGDTMGSMMAGRNGMHSTSVSGGNGMHSTSADTLHPNNTMMGNMMAGMHGMASGDSLHAGEMMTGVGVDTMHTTGMEEHHGSPMMTAGDSLHTTGGMMGMMNGNHGEQGTHGATVDDSLHTGGMMGMMSGNHGGMMPHGQSGEGGTQKENPPGAQPNPSDSSTQKDAHGH